VKDWGKPKKTRVYWQSFNTPQRERLKSGDQRGVSAEHRLILGMGALTFIRVAKRSEGRMGSEKGEKRVDAYSLAGSKGGGGHISSLFGAQMYLTQR